jgi:hypothetical protein
MMLLQLMQLSPSGIINASYRFAPRQSLPWTGRSPTSFPTTFKQIQFAAQTAVPPQRSMLRQKEQLQLLGGKTTRAALQSWMW